MGRSKSAHTRLIDAKWRLPVDGAEFAERLITHRVDEDAACRMAMVTRRTLQRRRKVSEQVAYVANQARQPAFQSGEIATNRGSEGNHPGCLDLSHSRA